MAAEDDGQSAYSRVVVNAVHGDYGEY